MAFLSTLVQLRYLISLLDNKRRNTPSFPRFVPSKGDDLAVRSFGLLIVGEYAGIRAEEPTITPQTGPCQ